MNNKTKSLLTEISNYVPEKGKVAVLEARASHVLMSAINLLAVLEENFSPEEFEYLEKRLLSSIKYRDPTRFTRGLKKTGK